jgi:hypothetical protein
VVFGVIFYSCNHVVSIPLTQLVPPSSPRIRSKGKDIISNGILGPVAENELIDLTCDTVGGTTFCIYFILFYFIHLIFNVPKNCGKSRKKKWVKSIFPLKFRNYFDLQHSVSTK